jgi:hypothetical protein
MRSLFILGALLVACSHVSSRPVSGPDGQPGWYAIDCKRTHANCEQRAGELCPGGYTVARSDGRQGVLVVANEDGASARTTYRGEMLVKCAASSP